MSGFTCPFCHLIFLQRTEFQHHLHLEHPERMPQPGSPEPAQPDSDAPAR